MPENTVAVSNAAQPYFNGKVEMSGNLILNELVYDPSSGALRYKGVRYQLIRLETISGSQKAINES